MRLSLRQTQRVVMTPLLQQAIQLLQLSTLELEQVVRKELEENPLLEEVAQETQDVDAEAPASPEATVTETPAPPATTEPVSKETASVAGERADELPFDLTSAVFDEPDERTPVSMEEREEMPFENLGRTGTSLDEHLNEQLRLATDDPRTVAIGEAIIGNLDDDGYLRAEVEEIAAGTGSSPDEVEKILRLVQAFDPTGVAARSVQECLLLQLTADAEPDPVAVEIVEKYFEDLERRRYADIARAMKLPLDRIMESIEEIQGLEPKPGRRFAISDQRYIAPDVSIHKVGDDYVVVLNEEGIPRLRVNALYRSLLRRGQAVRRAEAPLRGVAHQERGAAAAHPAQGDAEPGQVPARLPRQGRGFPASARAPGRRRGHRNARVHHQPRHHQQVRGDAAGTLRAQVLLPQRHRLRHGRDGLLGVHQEEDPRHGGSGGDVQAAVRPGRGPRAARARAHHRAADG